MAAPFRVYGPRWELALTPEVAAEIGLAAAREGIPRAEWIRRACAAALVDHPQTTGAS